MKAEENALMWGNVGKCADCDPGVIHAARVLPGDRVVANCTSRVTQACARARPRQGQEPNFLSTAVLSAAAARSFTTLS